MPYTLVLSGELTGNIFLQIDELLPQLGTVPPNGVYAAAHIGARYIDTVTKTEYKASLADGTIGGTTWDVVVNTIVDATETVKGVVEFATSIELAAGVDNTKAVTPFSMAGVFATVTDLQDEINDRISGDNALDVRLDAAETTLTNAVSAATPSVLMKRDAAGRAKVADGAASTDIATKGQMDTADSAIQSQVTSLATDVTTNATPAPTANRLVRRDASARFQAAAASAAADVVIKSQLDSTDAVVAGITSALGTPTDAATPSTIVKRDAAGRFKAVAGSAGSDVIVKTQLDSTDAVVAGLTSALGTPTDAATVSTIMKRDAAGRAKVTDGSAASDIATKGQVDVVATALGTPTASPTVSTIVKRDAAGRFQAVAGSAADDVVIKSQLDAVGTAPIVNGFRLTVSASDPIHSADITAASTIYALPYTSNQISIYNGSGWDLLTASSISIAVPSTQYFRVYNVYVYDNATVPTFELDAWDSGGQTTKTITAATAANPCVITTSTAHGLSIGDIIGIKKGTGTGTGWTDTDKGLDLKEFRVSAVGTTTTATLEGVDTSALTFSTFTGSPTLYKIPQSPTTAPVRQNGVWCKTGTLTRRWVGMFQTDGAGVVNFAPSVGNVGISNVDNTVKRTVVTDEPLATWTLNSTTGVPRSAKMVYGVTRMKIVNAIAQPVDILLKECPNSYIGMIAAAFNNQTGFIMAAPRSTANICYRSWTNSQQNYLSAVYNLGAGSFFVQHMGVNPIGDTLNGYNGNYGGGSYGKPDSGMQITLEC